MTGDLPNVILLVLDTVRADRLSCYGHSLPTTPNLDRLAAESVLYEQAISPACWTLPSHASLFTGLYPSEHGAQTKTMPPPPVPTLAETLSEAGYETIAICRNSWMGVAKQLQRGFEVCPDVWTVPRRSLPKRLLGKAQVALGMRDTGAKTTTQIVVEQLKRARQPFFLFANYMDVHAPGQHLGPFSAHGVSWPTAFLWRIRNILQTRRGTQWDAFLSSPSRAIELLNRMYDNDLHYLDRYVGVLLDFLSEAGLDKRSLLIVTSDHGENLGEHNLLWHFFSLHDTLLRVPLIIRLPRVLPAGHRVAAQVQLTDIVPSLLRRLGLSVPPPVDRAHRPDLFNSHSLGQGEWLAYAEHVPPPLIDKWAARNRRYDFHPLRRSLRAVRTRTHKYIHASDGHHALYDLDGDPGETLNLIGSEAALADQLAAELEQWTGQLSRSAMQAPEAEESASVAQSLRDLGYL